jgi:hypothetical protein
MSTLGVVLVGFGCFLFGMGVMAVLTMAGINTRDETIATLHREATHKK